jgi:TPR repeat protein
VQTDELKGERRRKAVAEVLGCQALEGVRPSSTHLAEMQRYADGLVSLDELLTELIECIRQCSPR